MPRSFLLLATTAACFSLLSGCGASSTTAAKSGSNPPAPAPPAPAINPAPAVSSVSPANLVAGSPAQTLTLSGTGFLAASTVQFNGTALPATFVNATTLQAQVPASALASGAQVPLTVTNPAPGGGASPAFGYSVMSPTPLLTALSPQSVPQGASATVTVTGSGFEANSQGQWNGSSRPTVFVNGTTLQVALSAQDTQTFGAGQITVNNPGPGGSATTPIQLAVLAATPTITSVSPSSIAVNATSNVPQQVLLAGSGFAANATVQANGQAVSVINRSAVSLAVSLPAPFFASAGSIHFIVTNPGSPSVQSNTATLTVVAPATVFSISPNSAPAGSPDTTITVSGNGFFADSTVQWNGTALATKFLNPGTLTAVIPASLLAGFVEADIQVSTPEATGAAPPAQPFSTFLALATNDLAWNAQDGMIYASTPGSAGPDLGNSIVAIDPHTGVIQKTIFVGSEPNRIAISDDGTTLFAGLNGAGAVRQVDLTHGTAGVQFSLGGGPGLYNLPYTAASLAAVPGEPSSVAVYSTDGVVRIFDGGMARPNTGKGLQTYFTSNIGALAFNGSASSLSVTSDAVGGYLYNLTVGSTGVTASKQLTTGNFGTGLQFDAGRLYVPTGLALDAATGSQLGQFSSVPFSSSTPVATVGPLVSDSALGKVWIAPTNAGIGSSILAFDNKTYNPVASLPLPGVGGGGFQGTSALDLIRWGSNGLALHTGSQVYVVHGPLVKDVSDVPADLALAATGPATSTTGAALTYRLQVSNLGQNTAAGVTLTAALPPSMIFGSVHPAQGSCSGTDTIYCDLGSLASGASTTVAISATPTTAGSFQTTAALASASFDPVTANNQSSVTTTVNGGLFSGTPVVTALSPALTRAGTQTFTLAVDGTGFTSASTVQWNGASLPTTLNNSGELTATVDASLVKTLGWAQVSVSSAAPGGGQSGALTFSIYDLLDVPANAIAYDPFTRKLYAALPSSSATLAGNSLVAIDPAGGSVGTPVSVGSEPNLLSETSDGNYLFVGLSGAKSLGRFNLLSQTPDLTVTLPTAQYEQGPAAAVAIAAVPGSDSTVAVETSSFAGIGILDISGSTGTFRKKVGFGYSGDNPVFVDATHFFAYDAYTTGAEFFRYSVDSNGAEQIDNTSLNGLGGFGGRFAVDGGLVYGVGGGIVNPNTTPPSQVAVLPFGSVDQPARPTGSAVVPYAAEGKSFYMLENLAGTAETYLARYDTEHFVLEQQLQLPNVSIGSAANGTRWGADGLAFVLPGSGTANASQVLLLRGPFVLPSEAVNNPAPALSGTDHDTIASGSGNTYITVTGSGFLPGAVVLWNGAQRETTFLDSAHLRAAVAAADLANAAAVTLSGRNPGSGNSNSLTIRVQ